MSKFILCIALVLTFLVTSCDNSIVEEIQKLLQKKNTQNPRYKGKTTPPTDSGQSQQEENKNTEDIRSRGDGQAQQAENEDSESVTPTGNRQSQQARNTNNGDTTTTKDEDAPVEYTFAFVPKEEHRVARTANTYTYTTIIETNQTDPANRTITYTSSSTAIAIVDNAGTVTFKTAGTVIITATKAEVGEHEEVTDSYTLYITTKPADKNALVAEINRAMRAHGGTVDLNYIDTSAITDMRFLFSTRRGYGLSAFNGDISKWKVGSVTSMYGMFEGATAFNGDISKWKVGSVTNMYGMFEGATAFNGDISTWDVSNVYDTAAMFEGATAFNGDISTWDVREVVSMYGMFWDATAFTGTSLNCWADRIHATIRNDWIGSAVLMFFDSGVHPVPTWYETTNITPPADCKPVNPKDSDRDNILL